MRAYLVVAACLLLFGCAKNEPVAEKLPEKSTTSEAEPVKQYDLRGEVVSLEEQGRIAKIKHEQIADWMGPMTMEFPVKEEADFAKLKAGQPIHAKVNVQGFSFWVSGVEGSTAPAK
jgi:Cu/Ag efflux protein CusF